MFACIVLAAIITPAAAACCHPADLGLAVVWPPDRCTAAKYINTTLLRTIINSQGAICYCDHCKCSYNCQKTYSWHILWRKINAWQYCEISRHIYLIDKNDSHEITLLYLHTARVLILLIASAGSVTTCANISTIIYLLSSLSTQYLLHNNRTWDTKGETVDCGHLRDRDRGDRESIMFCLGRGPALVSAPLSTSGGQSAGCLFLISREI